MCIKQKQVSIFFMEYVFFYIIIMAKRTTYIDKLENWCDRSELCKIFISAHPLVIEREDILIRVPWDKRFCLSVCNSEEIEDEEHFLFQCTQIWERNLKMKSNYLKLIYKIKQQISDFYAKISVISNLFSEKVGGRQKYN